MISIPKPFYGKSDSFARLKEARNGNMDSRSIVEVLEAKEVRFAMQNAKRTKNRRGDQEQLNANETNLECNTGNECPLGSLVNFNPTLEEQSCFGLPTPREVNQYFDPSRHSYCAGWVRPVLPSTLCLHHGSSEITKWQIREIQNLQTEPEE